MPKKKRTLVKVSKRAIVQRINRKLAADDQRLLSNRSAGSWLDLGDFYVVDTNQNAVVDTHIDLVHTARKLGALAEWEELAE